MDSVLITGFPTAMQISINNKGKPAHTGFHSKRPRSIKDERQHNHEQNNSRASKWSYS
jgi:hypothetical protein